MTKTEQTKMVRNKLKYTNSEWRHANKLVSRPRATVSSQYQLIDQTKANKLAALGTHNGPVASVDIECTIVAAAVVVTIC